MMTLTLDYPTAVEIQNSIIDRLNDQAEAIRSIQKSNLHVIQRWQAMLSISLKTQLETIAEYGFPKSQAGLSNYNKELVSLQLKHPDLQELNEKKWLFLFGEAFGIKELKTLTLEEARNLVNDMADAVTSNDFLKKVDTLMDSAPEGAKMVERRQALLTLLIPEHSKVMAKYGFVGETGYIEAQRALMDHWHDASIVEKSTTSQEILFKRAKLIETKGGEA